jgi:hypothetical protein
MKRTGKLLKSKIWQNGIIFLASISLIGLQGCVPKNTKTYRIGILCSADSIVTTIDGFKAKMDELGYHEGENTFYDIYIVKTGSDDQHRTIKKF